MEMRPRCRVPENTAGFTLIELLVVIILIAALAAVITPIVTSALGQGDTAQAASSLTGLQSGTQVFQIDVRSSPRTVHDLVNEIAAGDDAIDGNDYSRPARWNGPYLDFTIPVGLPAASSTDIQAGFGSNMCNRMFTVNAASTTSASWGASNVTDSNADCVNFDNVSGGSHAAAALDSIEHRDWATVDEDIDDGDGENQGRVRWSNAGNTAGSDLGRLVYLVTPLMPREKP